MSVPDERHGRRLKRRSSGVEDGAAAGRVDRQELAGLVKVVAANVGEALRLRSARPLSEMSSSSRRPCHHCWPGG